MTPVTPGQSAGSFSTTYHLVSPKSRGLFRRIIAQSGVGGFSPSYHHYTERQASKFGTKASELVGCAEERTRVACLRGKKVNQKCRVLSPTLPRWPR